MDNDFEKKYHKYKSKYLSEKRANRFSQNRDHVGGYFPEYDNIAFMQEIDRIRADSHHSAYEVLRVINGIWDKRRIDLKLVTAESLTGGMIFSTLVDIPYGGTAKYGCFGVYDTDAKRIFLGVTEPDVYTHQCVKQMAVGALLNSNASIAVAVSGNAMPDQKDPEMMKKLGEVFIGIAGYAKNVDDTYKIIVSTSVHNLCEELETCKLWAKIPGEKQKLKKFLSRVRQHSDLDALLKQGEGGDELLAASRDDGDTIPVPEAGSAASAVAEPMATPRKLAQTIGFARTHIGSETLISEFNDFQLTSMISIYIRHATTKHALDECIEFINLHSDELVVPDFVTSNRIQTSDNKLDEIRALNIDKPYYVTDSRLEIDTGIYDMTKKAKPDVKIDDISIDKRRHTNNKTLSYPENITIECLNKGITCQDVESGAPYPYYP